MQSKLAAAVDLAKQGYRVFPLVPNGKTPAIAKNWREIATSNSEEVARLWKQAGATCNIGIALDANTLVVDVDTRDGKQGAKSLKFMEALYDELPATEINRTQSGGEHFWFTVPGNSGAFPKTLATDIDLKGEGGYVVGPGSTIDERAYTRVCGSRLRNERSAEPDKSNGGNRQAPRANAPDWILQFAGTRTRTRNDGPSRLDSAVADLDTESATKRAIDWLEISAPLAIEGQSGDVTTIKVANHLGDLGLTEVASLALMLDHWNETKAIPSWDADELEYKVASAFRSRQNAIGVRNPEADFTPVMVDETKLPPKKAEQKGLFWQHWPQTQVEADKPYLIDGVLDAGTMIVTYGDSNTGKTFVALDQAYHIAANKPWNGHKVRCGPVVYVASEGGPGFAKRVEALKRTHGADDVPFYTVPCLVDLYSDNGSTGPLVKLIREIEAHAGEKVVLIVIDTLARAMGGGDENTSTDMGRFVANCDRIRAATGAALNIVHHTGKDKARGARGSSSLRAATDTEIEITAGALTMTKQRDGGKSEELKFALDVVEVGRRGDGAAVTSCVVRWLAVNEFSDEVSPQAEQMLEVLERLIAAKRDEISEDDETAEIDKTDKIEKASIPWKTWEKECLSTLKGARGSPIGRTHLFPIRQELSNSGKAAKDKYKQWFIK